MSIKVEPGNFVMYESEATLDTDNGTPKVEISILQVVEVFPDYFTAKKDLNEKYKYHRIRKITNENQKMGDFPGYDSMRCMREDVEACKKWTEKIMDAPERLDVNDMGIGEING